MGLTDTSLYLGATCLERVLLSTGLLRIELRSIDNDQMKLDSVYANLMELVASTLVEVGSKCKKSQAWFSKQLVELRRLVCKAESAWLLII